MRTSLALSYNEIRIRKSKSLSHFCCAHLERDKKNIFGLCRFLFQIAQYFSKLFWQVINLVWRLCLRTCAKLWCWQSKWLRAGDALTSSISYCCCLSCHPFTFTDTCCVILMGCICLSPVRYFCRIHIYWKC